jgi:hypothetical protein
VLLDGEDVELLDEGRVLALRDGEAVDKSDGLFADVFTSVSRLDSLGEDLPQSVLPLEAVFGESLQ